MILKNIISFLLCTCGGLWFQCLIGQVFLGGFTNLLYI